LLLTLVFLGSACDPAPLSVWKPPANDPQTASVPSTPSQDDQPPQFAARDETARVTARRRLRLDVTLNVLHVEVPRAQRNNVGPLWNYLREDVLDQRTVLRLHRNGLRVGVGHAQDWEAVKAALDAADGVRSAVMDPVRLPPNYPFALELDEHPREQTLFFVGDDGVLSGETWPRSRNFLRVSYDLNLTSPQRLRLVLVPEVRQRQEGWRWVRHESGLVQMPEYGGRAFGAAAFAVDLEAGEFLLVAPSEQADLYGLIGGAFLCRRQDDQLFDSYIFLRSDVNRVAQRD